MNQAEVLCHSSGPWKKHKYFQKIGEGANAVYKYAKKAYGSQAREDMDKYGDALERSFANQRSANDTAYNAMLSGNKDLEKRADEYFDKQHAMGERYMNYKHNAADDYYKSAAYKVDKATGRYAKDEANRYLREGGTKQGEYYNRRMDEYNKSIGGKAEKVSKAAKSTVAKGEQILKNMFKTQTTITKTSNLMPTGTKKTIKK